MPFLSIYLLALEQDMEYGMSVLQTVTTLQHQTFLQVSGQCGVQLLPGLHAGLCFASCTICSRSH